MAQVALGNKMTTQRQGHMSKRRRREALTFYILISPFILGFLGFTLFPMVASLYVSFTTWDLISTPTWTGLSNYQQLFTADPDYIQGIKVTLSYALGALPLGLITTFTLAMMMNKGIRGINFFRAIYYMPSLLTGVSVAVLWIWVLDNKGILNNILAFAGVPTVQWLTDPQWALRSFIMMSLWTSGGGILIYLAGLNGIPTHLYEAAEIDGAGWWVRFWRVTIPMMTPTIFFNLVNGLIGVLQFFAESYVLTNGGPPVLEGDNIVGATRFYMLKLYNDAFGNNHSFGYAAAQATILFVFILACTLVIVRTSSSWVYYEGDVVKGG